MKIKSFICSLAALLMVVFCQAATANETIKIGLLTPLTGFASTDGFSVLESVKMAVEDVNNDGGLLGKKVELVYYDDAADSKQAVNLANKLINQDKVVAFVAGSYSMPSRAVAPLFDEAEVPLVAAYAIHPEITNGDFTFRNGFLGTVEGRVGAHVAVEMFNAKKMALITSDNDFGQTLAIGFTEYLKKLGRDKDLVLHLTYPGSEKDFKVYLAKVKEAAPDFLFFSGYHFQTGPALKQAREMGLENIQYFGEQGADSPKTSEIAGDAAKGFIIATNLDRGDQRPIVQNYLNRYRERYKEEANMVGASAYDSFMIIADSIKRANSVNGNDIRQAIVEIRDYNGLTGKIAGFDKDGEVIKPVQLQIIKDDGKFHHYGIVGTLELITPTK